jgi:hypothetical protein
MTRPAGGSGSSGPRGWVHRRIPPAPTAPETQSRTFQCACLHPWVGAWPQRPDQEGTPPSGPGGMDQILGGGAVGCSLTSHQEGRPVEGPRGLGGPSRKQRRLAACWALTHETRCPGASPGTASLGTDARPALHPSGRCLVRPTEHLRQGERWVRPVLPRAAGRTSTIRPTESGGAELLECPGSARATPARAAARRRQGRTTARTPWPSRCCH